MLHQAELGSEWFCFAAVKEIAAHGPQKDRVGNRIAGMHLGLHIAGKVLDRSALEVALRNAVDVLPSTLPYASFQDTGA